MPPTQPCALGASNKARVENLEKTVDELKIAVIVATKDVHELANHFSQRPTWFVALLITALVSLVLALIQHVVTN
jgi:hypothetical protein